MIYRAANEILKARHICPTSAREMLQYPTPPYRLQLQETCDRQPDDEPTIPAEEIFAEFGYTPRRRRSA